MLTFLLYTLIMWLAGNCILYLFMQMIQPEGALDVVFGWQKMLAKLYESPSKGKQLLGKALGDCQMCTAFWFMPVWFCLYWLLSRLVIHYFITDEVQAIGWKVVVFFVWYMVFHAVGAMSGLLALIKFKRKPNAV